MKEREKVAMNVRLPPELHKVLTAEAERLGVSANGLLCLALDHWLHQRGKV